LPELPGDFLPLINTDDTDLISAISVISAYAAKAFDEARE